VVIGLASEDAKATAEHAVADFKALGVSDVQALPETTLEATRVLQHASGVYLSGGDQQRLVDAMAALQLIAPLREVWCRGGVIAGTSAGAAVMSAVMITGEEHGLATEEERFRSIQRDRIATTNGFGFLTNAIIDQHFITRKRLNRLFSAVLEHPQLLGIGIDESTALIVDPSERCEVIGERTVMLIDARHSRSIHTARDGRFGVNNLTVHLLVSGDRFDVKRRRPILSKK
jgi:cyanophycinase